MHFCRHVLLLLLAGLVLGCAQQRKAEAPAGFDFSEHLRGKVLLFVGAHPDDEWGVAPLFAEACLFNSATCHFVVASEARSWGCVPTIGLRDPIECSRLRRVEMTKSAQALGGTVVFFGWEDYFGAFNQAGMEQTITRWAEHNGGREALVARFRQVLDTVRPDRVFAHDPRHGTTCHPNHRAVTLLLLEALGQISPAQRPEVWFENDVFVDELLDKGTQQAVDNGALFVWPNEKAPVFWYDAAKRLPDGKRAYDYLIGAQKAHATQYPDVASGKRIPSPPAAQMRIPFTRLQDIDARQDLCTTLALRRPSFDPVTGPRPPRPPAN